MDDSAEPAIQRTRRKHYTPLRVDQQTEVEPDKRNNGDHDETETHFDYVNDNRSHDQSQSCLVIANENGLAVKEHSTRNVHRKQITSVRTLGGLEHMYNIYSKSGAEVVCLMTKIETVYPVTETIALRALLCLTRRHPLLRMCIRPRADSAIGECSFAEQTPLQYDFRCSTRSDWLEYLLEEAAKPFDDQDMPLFRCRLLNSAPNGRTNEQSHSFISAHNAKSSKPGVFGHEATLLYVIHHSIMDGGYCLWLFQEHLNFIDAIAMGKGIGKVKELPVLRPVECILQSSDKSIKPKYSSAMMSQELQFNPIFCHDATNDKVLQDYRRKFHEEITTLSTRRPTNGCVTFRMSKSETRAFIQTCKAKGCSPKGAISSAWFVGLLDLVYSGTEQCDIEMPFEYMLDFRRFCDLSVEGHSVPHYPGLATMHIPLKMHIKNSSHPMSNGAFWELVEGMGDFLEHRMITDSLFQWIKSEAELYRREPQRKHVPGKSPYVLCISNMGKCDGVIHNEVNQRARLVGLHGHSTILIDDMPLFFVTTFLLNGHLCGNVSFCESYTSYETATKYVAQMQAYLTSKAKL